MSTDAAVAWLREQVQARLTAAKAVEAVAESPWGTFSVTPAWAGFPEEAAQPPMLACVEDAGDAVLLVALRYVLPYEAQVATANHIALNDPRDVIARCEAELGILERYRAATEDFTHVDENVWEFSRREALEGVVELLASGYKHRPGYAEHWGQQ